MAANRHARRRIANERAHAARASALSGPRCLAALFGLLALFIQSFIVQTHIHVQQGAGASRTSSILLLAKNAPGVALATAAKSAPSPDKYPISGDPLNCPLCQEIAHSGQFVASAAVLAALPASAAVHFIVFRDILPSLFADSHSWRGRAPPRA